MIKEPSEIFNDYYKVFSQSFEENFDVFEYFYLYNEVYFDNALGCIQLSWSKKMTSCAGVFSVNNNIPSIRLSDPLLKYRQVHEIKETLLHEMIHAFCYIKQYDMSDDLSGHGKYFKQKMNELNKETGLNITVRHSFHDEVSYYASHVWRCNGMCQNNPPYFGYVRRQMNRPPQKADKWWKEHQQKCGGSFIKISNDKDNMPKTKRDPNKSKHKTKINKKDNKENKKDKNNSHTLKDNNDKEEIKLKRAKNKNYA